VINHKRLHEHIARQKAANARAILDAQKLLVTENEEKKNAERLEKAEITAKMKAEIKAHQGTSSSDEAASQTWFY